MENIGIRGQLFVDESGRERIFHGVNVIDKGYVPLHFAIRKRVRTNTSFRRKFGGVFEAFDDELCTNMRDMGVNLLRLGVNWEAVEPNPGEYDEEYIDKVEKVFDICAKYGIYVFLDMHQDLYSGFGDGVGDGAPSWATLTGGKRYHMPIFGAWAEPYFFGKAVAVAFDNFWNNTKVLQKGLMDRYAEMWQHLAKRFMHKENFFGFDFMNEPHPGSKGTKAFRKIALKVLLLALFSPKLKTFRMLRAFIKGDTEALLKTFTPEVLDAATRPAYELIKEFDTTYYSQFMNKMTSAVRKVGKRGIITMSHSYWSNIGIPFSTPRCTAIDGKDEPNQCFAPHAYDLVVDTPAYNYASEDRVSHILKEHKRAQERLNAPVILAEWGGHSPGTGWESHVEALYDVLDENLWSNTYFCSIVDWRVEPVKNIISRPYPIAVCGKINKFRVDREARFFEMTFEQSQGVGGSTEIFLPSAPKSVICDGKYAVEMQGKSAILSVYELPAGKNTLSVTY